MDIALQTSFLTQPRSRIDKKTSFCEVVHNVLRGKYYNYFKLGNMDHCASKNCSNLITQFSFKVEATVVNWKGLKLALVTVAEKIVK